MKSLNVSSLVATLKDVGGGVVEGILRVDETKGCKFSDDFSPAIKKNV